MSEGGVFSFNNNNNDNNNSLQLYISKAVLDVITWYLDLHVPM